MARPKAFDREEALQQAMQLFWEKGYASTSMQDLVDRMGIGRASLYDTFGSKQDLFHEAIALYADRMTVNFFEPLSRPGPAPKVVRDFLQSVVDSHLDGTACCCLVVKTAISDPPDEETAEACRDFTKRMEDAYYRLLVREGFERPRALARFLTHSTQTIGVTATMRPDRRVLSDIIKTTVSVLG